MTQRASMVDSHCHLQDAAFDGDREAVLARSLEAVDWLVVIGDDLPSSEAAVGLTGPGVYASAGVHPYHAASVPETISAIEKLTRADRVVAVGEIGLDYYKYNETPKETQREALEAQLDLAARHNLPVVIHNRESSEDLGAILEHHAERLPGGVMHCFSGDTALAERALGWGFYISFAGNLTFPKADPLRAVARSIPLDRLLVETDSPYLAPQPVRGKRCEPRDVAHTVRRLAEVLGRPESEVVEATSENAARLFQIQQDGTRRT